MGDWRAQGSAMRRRQGAPSHHGGGSAQDVFETPNGLMARMAGTKIVDGPTDDDPRTTYAVPLYSDDTLVDYQQHRAEDEASLLETMGQFYTRRPGR